MPEPKGRSLPLSGPRKFIIDLVHFASQVPSIPVARTLDVGPLIDARRRHLLRPSWAALFMRAYALVCAEHPPLRRAYLAFPWPRLYEHPISVCAMAFEREHEGEEGIFVGLFRDPANPTLGDLQAAVNWYKTSPPEEIGFYRQALRISRLPRFLRRFLWWSTLNLSGFKRAKRFGTFGLSTYGALGAESLHPISPLTTTLTYGPIDPETGRVVVKLIYDHRVLDGAYIARRLEDLERALRGPVLDELRAGSADSRLVPAERPASRGRRSRVDAPPVR
jgi:hypothetical protein